MKTFITILTFIMAFGQVNAQTVKREEVPALVRESFKSLFPAVQNETWEKEGGHYEADFSMDKTATSAIFDGNGKFIQTEHSMSVNELPAGITDHISKNMVAKKASEATKITSVLGKTTYEVELDGVDYVFEPDGRLIKKEMDDSMDDDTD